MQASWEPVPEGLKRGNELEIAEESDALRPRPLARRQPIGLAQG